MNISDLNDLNWVNIGAGLAIGYYLVKTCVVLVGLLIKELFS